MNNEPGKSSCTAKDAKDGKDAKDDK